MREVIYIEKKENVGTPVEFTHYHTGEGWASTDNKEWTDSAIVKKVAYLGKCELDGDMFALYNNYGCIIILKGHLNSGFYNI